MITGLVASGAVIAGAVNVTDDFTAADGTALNGRTTTTGGKTWVGTGTITGNQAAGVLNAVVDVGYADIDMTVVITIGSSNEDGVRFRQVDSNNDFRVALKPTAGDVLVLSRKTAGSETVQNTSGDVGTMSAGEVGTMRVRTNGTAIKIYWNAVLWIDTTNASHTTGTKHGINGTHSGYRADSFSVVPYT